MNFIHYINYSLFSLLFFFGLNDIYAQNSIDSNAREINEAVLIRNQQQANIDSLVKQKLEQELKAATGDRQKTLALEKKLKEIEQADSLRKLSQFREIATLKKTTKGYPVVLNLDTLFYIYTRIGSFDAQQRSLAISEKIKTLYEDAFYNLDSLRIRSLDDNSDIIYKDQLIILTVSNLDCLWLNKSNAELTKEYLAIVKSTIAKERQSHSLTNWLKRIGLALLIILMLLAIIKIINYLFRKTASYIIHHKALFQDGLKFKNTQIITAQYLEGIFLKINSVVKIIVIILAIYLSLPLLFSIFPETESWTNTLLNWILSPLKAAGVAIAGYLPNLFTILVVYFIFKYVIKAVRFFFREVRVGNVKLSGFHQDWAMPTFNILRVMFYAFMLVIMFPYLPGSGSPAFQGVSVFLGILLSLGSSSAISNMVAGLVITYMRPFKVGDRVKIGEVVGDVIEKTMLVTRIRTIKNEDITVPNSMVLSSSTVNYSSRTRKNEPGLILHYTVTIGYDVPWKQVYELLIQAAEATIHIEKEPAPFVLQTSLDNYYISYQINAYTRQANLQAGIYSNLLENIQEIFSKAGVEILSPQYNVIRNEE
jgi:small-conductance mechanosensitive channel